MDVYYLFMMLLSYLNYRLGDHKVYDNPYIGYDERHPITYEKIDLDKLCELYILYQKKRQLEYLESTNVPIEMKIQMIENISEESDISAFRMFEGGCMNDWDF
jgi:hypothetical protein